MRYQLIKQHNVDLGYRLYYFLSILLMFPLKFIIKRFGIRIASSVSSIILVASNICAYFCWYYDNKLLVAISELLLFGGGPFYLILEFI
mmetsp:Transcript_21686/g.3577  ORF Transcript_21686/g.3577 Transcript_21686/m.3577 type:complete len:89 (-) Transcript_21686:1557-1823(-)